MGLTPKLIVADSKDVVPKHLNEAIVSFCIEALQNRGVFTIALSGGSLPSFLSTMKEAFDAKSADPKFDAWNVILADERCVPETDDDSNLKALKENLLSAVPIPPAQVFGINESKLSDPAAVASEYEEIVKTILSKSGGKLDLAVLGFGPDGHTCSLFPDHPLLKEDTKMVAPIMDSPKPPPNRITLTFPVLNKMTRHVIFCGAGGSKAPILKANFASILKAVDVPDGTSVYDVTYANPPPYPCAMVMPEAEGTNTASSLTWVVDAAAVEGLPMP